MRIKIWERILAALCGLLVLLIGVGVFVYGVGVFPFKLDLEWLQSPLAPWQRAAVVAGALLLCLLGVHGLSLLFRSSREKGFIMQHTEYGDLSISMHAMENMVKKCIDSHEELKVTGTRIHHSRDGVVVNMHISLANGVNIPIAVSALQKQIKQYITSCSGVDVKEVRVMVETNGNVAQTPGTEPHDALTDDVNAIAKAGSVAESIGQLTPSAQTTEDVKETAHQRIFKPVEEPQIVPAPPAEEPAAPSEDATASDEAGERVPSEETDIPEYETDKEEP